MQYRKLGRAGIKLSVIGLGGWAIFSDSDRDPDLAREIILKAYEGGVNFFDIADEYGYGEAERTMGKVFKELPRHTLVISSKLFLPMSNDVNDRGLSRKHIFESIVKSLQRIGTDYLDIYFCHRYDPDTPNEEVVRAMDDLVHQGKILYWGTSRWSPAQVAEAVGVARRYNLYAPQVEQAQYSILYRSWVEQQMLPVTQHYGMGLVVWSPLAMGMLTGKYDNGLPEDSRMAREDWAHERWFNEENRQRVSALAPLANELGIPRAQLALAWVLRQPGITSAITGATRTEHIDSNLRAAELVLPPKILERIDDIAPLGSKQ